MPSDATDLDAHSTFSVLRERILEHLFVGELLRLLWRRQVWDVEVLRSEFDAYGYDLVLTRGDTVRHVQLKTKRLGGSTREAKVGLSLQEKPSACIVCMVVDDHLTIDHFLWFGSQAGQPLPPLARYRAAKHTKANAEGVKSERLQHCVVPFTHFTRISTLDQLLGQLFAGAQS